MFEECMGREQAQTSNDPHIKRGIELWLKRVDLFYQEFGGGVDVEVIDDMLLLTENSVDYLYHDFTALNRTYVPGSRPELEKVLSQIIHKDMSCFEKVLAIMRRVRDNQDHGLASPRIFYGGSEEDLLKRGAVMCNEVSRLCACLCQIAGIPARLFCSHISGHMMNEVYVDGKWIFLDAMKGLLPLGSDGHGLSAWEIHLHPDLLCRQEQAVFTELRTPEKPLCTDDSDECLLEKSFILCRTRDCYFHKREAIAIGNYYVADYDSYTYPWAASRPPTDALLSNVREEHLNRQAMGWPDHYFNKDLFNERVYPIKDHCRQQ